jgi:hypothetical protein
MMLENFDRFTEGGKSYVPKISIRKRGQIGFNNGAFKKFDLENRSYAILYMSKDKRQIAIRFTNDPDEKGVVKLVKKAGNSFVSGKTFLDYHEIEYNNIKKRSFEAEWYPEEQAAVIDIAERETKKEGDAAAS